MRRPHTQLNNNRQVPPMNFNRKRFTKKKSKRLANTAIPRRRRNTAVPFGRNSSHGTRAQTAKWNMKPIDVL